PAGARTFSTCCAARAIPCFTGMALPRQPAFAVDQGGPAGRCIAHRQRTRSSSSSVALRAKLRTRSPWYPAARSLAARACILVSPLAVGTVPASDRDARRSYLRSDLHEHVTAVERPPPSLRPHRATTSL